MTACWLAYYLHISAYPNQYVAHRCQSISSLMSFLQGEEKEMRQNLACLH
jgi:hypothetical protein